MLIMLFLSLFICVHGQCTSSQCNDQVIGLEQQILELRRIVEILAKSSSILAERITKLPDEQGENCTLLYKGPTILDPMM